MAHNRKLTLGTSELVMWRYRPHRDIGQAIEEVRDFLEEIMIRTEFLAPTPFKFIDVTVRLGLKNDSAPEYLPFDREYQSLDLAIEIDVRGIKELDRDARPVEIKHRVMVATATALIHAAQKYGLPCEELIAVRDKYTAAKPDNKASG